jgi:hypothetical protein
MTDKSGQKIKGVIAVAVGKAATVAVDNRDAGFCMGYHEICMIPLNMHDDREQIMELG